MREMSEEDHEDLDPVEEEKPYHIIISPDSVHSYVSSSATMISISFGFLSPGTMISPFSDYFHFAGHGGKCKSTRTLAA
ncbi:unnamed protein product [Cochlearia groenlandica]